MKHTISIWQKYLLGLLFLVILLPVTIHAADLSEIAPYSENPWITINDNMPTFSDTDLSTDEFEYYSALDALGRCGSAYANICKSSMPTTPREELSSVTPSGWHSASYDIIEEGYLFHRCHLIGYQLAGENANELNIITGTRYLNVDGMLSFENQIADYVSATDNHVLYRVTPVYDGENLIASGVELEAMSVEDKGAGLSFHLYCYNVQPGIWIDYETGESALLEEAANTVVSDTPSQIETEFSNVSASDAPYVLNTNTKKFHHSYCDSVDKMKEKNKQYHSGPRDDIIGLGYVPCKNCNP